MPNEFERRLGALEAKVATNQRGTYAGLNALLDAGLLVMNDLTDTELWWLICGREEDAPSDEAEVERRLADVVRYG